MVVLSVVEHNNRRIPHLNFSTQLLEIMLVTNFEKTKIWKFLKNFFELGLLTLFAFIGCIR